MMTSSLDGRSVVSGQVDRVMACLPLREPALWTEPCFGLGGARWHHGEGDAAYHASKYPFDEEEVPPPALAAMDLEDARRQEGTNYVRHIIGHPEDGETDGN